MEFNDFYVALATVGSVIALAGVVSIGQGAFTYARFADDAAGAKRSVRVLLGILLVTTLLALMAGTTDAAVGTFMALDKLRGDPVTISAGSPDAAPATPHYVEGLVKQGFFFQLGGVVGLALITGFVSLGAKARERREQKDDDGDEDLRLF